VPDDRSRKITDKCQKAQLAYLNNTAETKLCKKVFTKTNKINKNTASPLF
jgi:hypothetical protein